jgi:hypothetical protein
VDSNTIDLREDQLRPLNTLCDWLDILASPNIEENEEKVACAWGCGMGDEMPEAIRDLINTYMENAQSIIGDIELNALRQLKERLSCRNEWYYYDEKAKGFSKKQNWLDFVDFINMVNALLKDAVKRDTEKTLIKI